MKYTEYRIYTSHGGAELLQGVLLRLGVESVAIEDPADVREILEKKNDYDWDYIDESLLDLDKEPCVSFYMSWETPEGAQKMLSDIPEDAEQRESDKYAYRVSEKIAWEMELARELERLKYEADFPMGSLEVRSRAVDDSDWKDKWKEYFKPVKVSESLVVKPSWEEYEAREGEKIIEIDPQTAFGTGTHETTSLCLRAMEKYGAAGKRLLDVGTGSGILAIAAGLLGAEEVVAVDIDPQAVAIAAENVRKNGLSEKVRLHCGNLTDGVFYMADMVTANLMAELVCRFAPDAAKHLSPGGCFISSGILTEKKASVAEAVEKAGFEIVEAPEEGEWCALVAVKCGSPAKPDKTL